MKDNCSYRFDAILAVALEQDARQELAALPTPAALNYTRILPLWMPA